VAGARRLAPQARCSPVSYPQPHSNWFLRHAAYFLFLSEFEFELEGGGALKHPFPFFFFFHVMELRDRPHEILKMFQYLIARGLEITCK
jgi:hypothetical protein